MDHSPLFDAERAAHAAHAALIADITAQLITAPAYPPGGTPAQPALPPPSRFVQWGGYRICATCRYAEEFCGCGKAPSPPTQGDGADSTLVDRIRRMKGAP